MLTQEKNPVTLLRQSLKCQAYPIDAMKLNDLYFINSACFGVDSIIATHAVSYTHLDVYKRQIIYYIIWKQHI